jgi:hypothetical protein
VNQLKLSEILQLDCRKIENKKALNVYLVEKTPFFKKHDPAVKVDTDDIVAVLEKISDKYPLIVAYMMRSKLDSNEKWYSFMIKRIDNNEYLKTAYGYTVWEGFAKALLYIYGYIKNNLAVKE